LTLLNFQLPKPESIFETVSWKHEVGSVNENSKAFCWTSKKDRNHGNRKNDTLKRKQNLKVMSKKFF